MKKIIFLLITILTIGMMNLSFAESTVDVTLEWSDFTSEYSAHSTFTTNRSKEQVIEHAKEDAMEFIATEGDETSAVLEIIMQEIRSQNKDISMTDLEIAKKIVNGKIKISFAK